MPETRLERIIFALGLFAIAGIAVLIAFARTSDSATSAPAAGSTTATRPATASLSTTLRQEPATQTQTPTPAPAPSGVRLRLTASRADSWVEIRSGSSVGKVLYVGVMAQGEARSFRGSKLYARFGNAGSFDARLDGVAIQLQPGTYSALVTRRGLEQVSAG